MLSRREFLVASAAITASTASDASAQQPVSSANPNILFILADDLGWGDLSCYGRPDYKTPVLDDLAARGVRLTQAYANSSTCSPTRVALITGRYQTRLPVGLYDPLPGGAPAGLPPKHPTLPGLLRAAGYRTALVGKWHLGFPPAFGPLKSGYDEFFGFMGGGMTYFTHKSGPFVGVPAIPALYDGEARIEREGYATDLFADRAAEIVGRADPKPFFLSLHFNAPHWPWEGPPARRQGRNPAGDEHGLASDVALGRRCEARSCLSGGWRRSHARPQRPYAGVRAHGVLAHAGHAGRPPRRLEVRALGHARVSRESRRGRDGERELQAEERGDVRSTQARVRGLGQADAADPTRGPTRPLGKSEEPRARPRTREALTARGWRTRRDE